MHGAHWDGVDGGQRPPAVVAYCRGGEPFAEQIVMWWNFVAATGEEVARARADGASGERFGPVPGYRGDPLPAPSLPDAPLKSRGRTR